MMSKSGENFHQRTASRETGQQQSVWNLGCAKERAEIEKENKQSTVDHYIIQIMSEAWKKHKTLNC